MINYSDKNIPEEFMVNRNAAKEKINLQRKLKQISETHSKVPYYESVTPVLKYHTKSLTSNSFELESSQAFSSGRSCDQPLASKKLENSVENNLSSKSIQHFSTLGSNTSANLHHGLSTDLCNNSSLTEKTASLDTNLLFSNSLPASNSFSPRVGPTGSLLIPARFQRKVMLPDPNGTMQTQVRNRSINVSNGKPLPTTQFSQYPVSDLATMTITQQKWPQSSKTTRYERQRPSSASLRSPSFDTKATNTMDSYLNRADPLLKPMLPSASCSYIGNGTNSLNRPKSSYRQRLMNSQNKSLKNNFSIGSKLSDPSVKDFCIVNHNPILDSTLHSARINVTTKKLKPVEHELGKGRSNSNKDRLNGLNKLNLAIKSSSLASSNIVPSTHVNGVVNSNSSANDSSGISSSCSFCSEAKSDCTCKTDLSKKCPQKFTPSHKLKPQGTNLHDKRNSVKTKKGRPLTSGRKAKKPTNGSPVSTLGKTSSDIALSSMRSLERKEKFSNASTTSNLLEKKVNELVLDVYDKSGRSCGDGAEDINKKIVQKHPDIDLHHSDTKCESGRLPGDGIEFEVNHEKNHEEFSPEFDYEDSLLDATGGGEEDEEYTNEMIEDIGSCQSSLGTGEFFPCDDDDDALDCIDDSAVASLDEDYAGSECAESESSGVMAYYRAQSENGQISTKKPAFIESVFTNCPAVINFSTHLEPIDPLPFDVRKLLKWKMSPITPIVVRNTVMRSGFKPSKKGYDWQGYFGKHMKSNGFRSLREYQKINHFPGSFQLGRKDRLWRNISRMQTRYGKKEFGFAPRSYVLPWDKKLLKNAWEEGGSKQKYILKPPASARGIGIKVIHKWNQLPTKKPILVQKYLSRPYLINGNKFDLRLYVHVTSFDPLRIYLFDDGLVRFATCKYSSSMKNLSNRYMHLTNYSINKKSGEFQQNDDASICQGHKWSLKALWGYMQQKGINTDKIWEQMKDIVIKTIISVEQFTNSLVKSNCRRRYCCHELFGFDVMLDDRLRPWLLEVNISPSLHSNSPLDVQIKGAMVRDMFNLCGFLLPDKKQIMSNAPSSTSGSSVPSASATFSQDKRKQSIEVTADSKAKHTYFAQHYKTMDEQSLMSLLLDTLTVNDIRILVESEGESARSGEFQKIFPCVNKKYLSFFEQPRYYNELLYAWEVRYGRHQSKGNGLLESFCRKGLHLPHVVADPNNIPPENVWNPNYATHPKVTPSPRIDSRILLNHKPPSGSIATLHSPTVVTTLSLTSGRSKSAKPYRTRSEDGAAASTKLTNQTSPYKPST